MLAIDEAHLRQVLRAAEQFYEEPLRVKSV